MQLTENNVKEVLLDASMSKTVFLYFYIDGPECAKTTSALESQISDNNEYVSLVKANITDDVSKAIAMQIGLQGVPALVVFQQGRPVDAWQGDDILSKMREIIAKYMPSDAEVLLRDALQAESEGDLETALSKAREAYELDEKDLQAKHIYARLLIKNKNLDSAEALLQNPGREEAQSQNYQDLLSALNLAKQAQESPEILELEAKYAADPHNDEVIVALAVALSEAGKKERALTVLLTRLKEDLGIESVKKTFLDILSTMAGDPLQSKFRRKLYTLMY